MAGRPASWNAAWSSGRWSTKRRRSSRQSTGTGTVPGPARRRAGLRLHTRPCRRASDGPRGHRRQSRRRKTCRVRWEWRPLHLGQGDEKTRHRAKERRKGENVFVAFQESVERRTATCTRVSAAACLSPHQTYVAAQKPPRGRRTRRDRHCQSRTEVCQNSRRSCLLGSCPLGTTSKSV